MENGPEPKDDRVAAGSEDLVEYLEEELEKKGWDDPNVTLNELDTETETASIEIRVPVDEV